jgi:hypothetical protein
MSLPLAQRTVLAVKLPNDITPAIEQELADTDLPSEIHHLERYPSYAILVFPQRRDLEDAYAKGSRLLPLLHLYHISALLMAAYVPTRLVRPR